MDAAAWPSHIKLAVNLSAVQFIKGNLFDVALWRTGGIRFVAGTAGAGNRGDVRCWRKNQVAHLLTVRQLKKSRDLRWCSTIAALGYSSASYLREFPFDKIKIDRDVSCKGLPADATAQRSSHRCWRWRAASRSLPQPRALRAASSSRPCRPAGVDFCAKAFLFGPAGAVFRIRRRCRHSAGEETSRDRYPAPSAIAAGRLPRDNRP